MTEPQKSVILMGQAANKLVMENPHLADASRKAESSSKRTLATVNNDKDAIIEELKRQLESEQQAGTELDAKFKERVETYIKRDTDTQQTMENLEKQLKGVNDEDYQRRMSKIRGVQGDVISALDNVQIATGRTLQDQERDLMRAFRARLHDVTQELEQQRSKQGDHSAELKARHRRVVKELQLSQDQAMGFDKKNQVLAIDNQKLQEKLRTREDDRQCLVRELANAKKEQARLKLQMDEEPAGDRSRQKSVQESAAPDEFDAGFSQTAIERQRLQNNSNKAYERELKYREEIAELKRALESEKRAGRALMELATKRTSERTDLEVLLRASIDEVQMEMARALREHSGQSIEPPGSMGGGTVQAMTAVERERVLELLLSQSRVVDLLYDEHTQT